ncbi:MAG: hypothetical protein NTU63_00205 [Candidatus Pacearchaeota archaeon]|nr:hypothetical protein [Candidatus Pacearchaeota archaeon]
MKEEDILFLNQLALSLEQAEMNLEESYKKKDYTNFNKSKKIMLKIQKQISEMLK